MWERRHVAGMWRAGPSSLLSLKQPTLMVHLVSSIRMASHRLENWPAACTVWSFRSKWCDSLLTNRLEFAWIWQCEAAFKTRGCYNTSEVLFKLKGIEFWSKQWERHILIWYWRRVEMFCGLVSAPSLYYSNPRLILYPPGCCITSFNDNQSSLIYLFKYSLYQLYNYIYTYYDSLLTAMHTRGRRWVSTLIRLLFQRYKRSVGHWRPTAFKVEL